MTLFARSALAVLAYMTSHTHMVHAASWTNMAMYMSGAQCGGPVAYVMSVYSPSLDCAASAASQSCLRKDANNGASHVSKYSGCFSAQSDANVVVSDPGNWAPTSSYGVLAPNTPYLAVTGLPGQSSCDASSTSKLSVVQTAYAADNTCHAMDGVFFKASCETSAGSVVFCTDSSCTDCETPITYSPGCNVVDGVAVSFKCVTSSDAPTSKNGTSDAITSAAWTGSPAQPGVMYSANLLSLHSDSDSKSSNGDGKGNADQSGSVVGNTVSSMTSVALIGVAMIFMSL